MPKPPHDERLLIITKTYPAPSTKHRETSCVAAISSEGVFRRLFPVPFRLLDGEQRFKKWEWIEAKIQRANDDRRPESYRIFVDTVVRNDDVVGTTNNWEERRRWIEPHVQADFGVIEECRSRKEGQQKGTGETLAYLRPSLILALEIEEARNQDWSEEEKAKLIHKQDGLFDTEDLRVKAQLRKLPHDFYYRYECDSPTGKKEYRHKITDWEVGALYWNVRRSHGVGWQKPFRYKLEEEFSGKDLLFLMGTIHRFPDMWLIVGLAYPPKHRPELDLQIGLAF
jgi:hypothetical protein